MYHSFGRYTTFNASIPNRILQLTTFKDLLKLVQSSQQSGPERYLLFRTTTTDGLVAVTVGTAGAAFTGLDGDPEYTPIQFEDLHGFLNVLIKEKKLVGMFYDNNAGKKDEFTILKMAPIKDE